MKLHRFETRPEFDKELAQLLDDSMNTPTDQPFAIMLAGGRSPTPAYRKLAQTAGQAQSALHMLFSDERMVPCDSPENNYAATLPMLNQLQLPENHILRVKTELSLEAAAENYHRCLASFLSKGGQLTLGLLGLGTLDGHTASLFSLDDARAGTNKNAIPVLRSPGPDRVSVTAGFLSKFQKLIIMAPGIEKQPMIETLQTEPETIPTGVALQNASDIEIWTCP